MKYILGIFGFVFITSLLFEYNPIVGILFLSVALIYAVVDVWGP